MWGLEIATGVISGVKSTQLNGTQLERIQIELSFATDYSRRHLNKSYGLNDRFVCFRLAGAFLNVSYQFVSYGFTLGGTLTHPLAWPWPSYIWMSKRWPIKIVLTNENTHILRRAVLVFDAHTATGSSTAALAVTVPVIAVYPSSPPFVSQ